RLTHSCCDRGGRCQCDVDLLRGDIRSDDEAEPRRASFEFRNFLAAIVGLPPVDSVIRGCQQRWTLVPRHRRWRGGGAFLPGLQELAKRTAARICGCK